MCSHQWLLRERACSMGPSPRSPGCPQGGGGSRAALLSFLCAWSLPLLDSSHVDPGDSGSSLGTC